MSQKGCKEDGETDSQQKRAKECGFAVAVKGEGSATAREATGRAKGFASLWRGLRNPGD